MTTSEASRSRRLALALAVALGGSLLVLPGAEAHPVFSGCSGGPDLWWKSYAAQFNPFDPNTWTSGLVHIGFGTGPVTCENSDFDPCVVGVQNCYPLPCFYRPFQPDCSNHNHVGVPIPV